MTTFKEIAAGKKKGRGKGCPICGEPNTGQVLVALGELGPDGRVNGGWQVTSRAISMCETHAVEAYDGALHALEGFGA